ncbi:MAG TPA: metallopeptidase TldD-related protein, partial [Mycobacterium sp.]|nr:metallopeptidase TldD-related protein [Mycobacterium sp.]
MIPAQEVVELALQAAKASDRCDETIVIVTDCADASLRWAGNSMTTNGVATSRTTSVISIVRQGDQIARVGVQSSSAVDSGALDDLVAASEYAAHTAPEAGDSAPLLTGSGEPADWGDPIPNTGASVFAELARELSVGFGRADRLYGFAHHVVETTFLGTSTGIRRRFTQPTGSVEINAKRGDASAWAGVSTPWFADVPVAGMLSDLSTRLGWAQRTVELPAGRYETLMPPSTVADMMIYLGWSMEGRGAQEGRTALSAPGGGTRVGERLSTLPLTLYSDPLAPGLECAPFVHAASSSERSSVFDNGMDIDRVDWIRDGAVNALVYSRAAAAEFGVTPAVPADNLLMTGGSADLADMVARTERGLLLTTL